MLDGCESYTEFMSRCKEFHTRDYVLNHERLEYFGKKHFMETKLPYVSPFTTFVLPGLLSDWLSTEFHSDKRRKKSLILIGPSKLGKTEWARSLGHHMYFNHMANFKDDWDDSANYIIFDDFEWDYIPNKKGFFGGQLEFQISGKYMKVKTVQWGKCCLYLTNHTPDVKECDFDWFRDNCLFLEVNNKFY